MHWTDFNQSFLLYTRNLRAFAYHLTQDQQDADDLYQDTAYKAFKYHHQYQPQTNLQAWLMTIMRNTFINEWRRKRRRQTHQDDGFQGYLLESSLTADNAGEGDVMIEEISGAIEQLDHSVREPFMLCYRGFKYEEIADHLALPLGTVKSRIHVARKQLQAQLRQWYQARSLADIMH